MRTLQITRVKISNFKSFRDADVEFAASPGLYFVGGENKIEPRLGANGAGKSTLFDAIIWCLYGVDARGHRTSEILRYGEKVCEVTVYFSNTSYVVRSGPPSRICICDRRSDPERPAIQEDVDQHVGLNCDRFLQSVVFGQKVPLFLDLSIPKRGELLDSVLGLEIWLRLSDLTSKKISGLESERATAKQELSRVEGQLSAFSDEAVIQQSADNWNTRHAAKVEAAINEIERAEVELEDVTVSLASARAEHDALGRMLDLQSVVANKKVEIHRAEGNLQQLDNSLDRCSQDLLFYQENHLCPSCKQEITWELAEEQSAIIESERSELKTKRGTLETTLFRLQEELLELEFDYQTKMKAEREIYSRVIRLEADHRQATRQVENTERNAREIIDEDNPYTEQLKRLREAVAVAQSGERKWRAIIIALDGKVAQLDYWKTGFKRVRLFLIKRVLMALEVEVNSAASTLGLPDWRIGFQTETETKSGSMKFGVQIDIKSPHVEGKWAAPSPGEEQRVRLAVALGLASMIQRSAGVYWSMECFDEPTAGLSVEGVADLLETLHYRAVATNRVIYLIDHRVLDSSAFAGVWTIVKDCNGSRVVQ